MYFDCIIFLIHFNKKILIKERRKLINDYRFVNIYDDKGNLKEDCKIKNYVDGSRYEG